MAEEEENAREIEQIAYYKTRLLKYNNKKRSKYQEKFTRSTNSIIFKALVAAIEERPCSMFFLIDVLYNIKKSYIIEKFQPEIR